MKKSNYKSHSVHEVIESHDNLQTIVKEKRLDTLSPFEKLFDEKLGLCAGKPLHFRVKNDHSLRCQTPYDVPTKYLPLVKQEVDRLVSLGVASPSKHATHAAPCFLHSQRKMELSVFLQILDN